MLSYVLLVLPRTMNICSYVNTIFILFQRSRTFGWFIIYKIYVVQTTRLLICEMQYRCASNTLISRNMQQQTGKALRYAHKTFVSRSFGKQLAGSNYKLTTTIRIWNLEAAAGVYMCFYVCVCVCGAPKCAMVELRDAKRTDDSGSGTPLRLSSRARTENVAWSRVSSRVSHPHTIRTLENGPTPATYDKGFLLIIVMVLMGCLGGLVNYNR